MQLVCLFWEDRFATGELPQFPSGSIEVEADERPSPAAFVAICVQCDAVLTIVVHGGPEGVELVALPEAYGGLTTLKTPPAVAYYLDQAQRSNAIGAHSAAVSMYRAALESLLYEQGYQEGMLGRKIDALERDDHPPSWRDELDPEYLRVIKDLGNAAIHPNDGEIARQRVFEDRLLLEVGALFRELLDTIYERPAVRSSRLDALRAAANSFRAQPPS